jgi:hypothetical protein
MSQTRRLAAILAAGVAGYSRLMGADEHLEKVDAAAGIGPSYICHEGMRWRTGWLTIRS